MNTFGLIVWYLIFHMVMFIIKEKIGILNVLFNLINCVTSKIIHMSTASLVFMCIRNISEIS